MAKARAPWNHNIAYFPFIERLAGSRPRRTALDVGTGDGMLADRLATSIPIVVGIDLHQEQVDGAAAHHDSPGLSFVVGDVLTTQLPGEPFDFVACSAALHHLPLRQGLERLRDLTAPGGTLVIVGLANNESMLDWILGGLSVAPVRIARAGRGWHEHGAPKKDPQESWAEIRRTVASVLSGAIFRRRIFWRYSVVWDKPLPTEISTDTSP
jgi:SAM-dependent methyltransferase